MKILQFSDSESWDISKLLAAILHLGNIEFIGNAAPAPTPATSREKKPGDWDVGGTSRGAHWPKGPVRLDPGKNEVMIWRPQGKGRYQSLSPSKVEIVVSHSLFFAGTPKGYAFMLSINKPMHKLANLCVNIRVIWEFGCPGL